MPDYAACLNNTCPKRRWCARYLMVWGERQSSAHFEAKGCTRFWEADKGPPFKVRTVEEADAFFARTPVNKE